MEVTRQRLGSGVSGEFRARQLTARRMLKGELEGPEIESAVEQGVMTTTLERAANWARGNAFMPATFGLACCAIEMMAAVNARSDIARFGFEALRASPRQADLIIISGRISIKMAPIVRRLWDQMLEPKWRSRWAPAAPRWGSSTTTRSSPRTSSCPSTSTCRAARRGRRR